MLLTSALGGGRCAVGATRRSWTWRTVGGTMPAPASGRQIVPDAAVRGGGAFAARPGRGDARHAQETTDLALIDRSAAVICGRTLILTCRTAQAGDALSRGGDRGDRARVRSPAGIASLPLLDEALAEDEEQGVVGEEMTGGKLDADEFAAFLAPGSQDDPPLSPA